MPPSHFLNIHLNIILPSTPGSSKWPLSLTFPYQHPVLTSPLPHTGYMTRAFYYSRFDNRIIFVRSTDHSAPSHVGFHLPVTSSLLGQNILLSTLFSNTLSLRSYLNVRDYVSHPHKTKEKIIVFYILIFMFLDSKLEDKNF